MNNPFEAIEARLSNIETLLPTLNTSLMFKANNQQKPTVGLTLKNFVSITPTNPLNPQFTDG